MPKVIYEVTLSPDGKHSVSVKSDDPISLKDALPVAKKIQESLADRPNASTAVSSAPKQTTLPMDTDPQAPVCGFHSTPMVQVMGKHGPFWSCHQRNPDGSWCSFKPARARSASPAYSYPTA